MTYQRRESTVVCAECSKQGKKSKVYEDGFSTKTLLHCVSFYDEDGKRHSHDGNTVTTGMTCSNGHKWQRVSKGSCWCGWGKQS